MNGLSKSCFYVYVFILNLLLISFAFPQINPNNEELVKKFINDSQISQYDIHNKSFHQENAVKGVTKFDSVLAFRFQSVMDSILVVNNIIGASAAINLPGKGTWFGIFGMSNPQKGKHINSDMLFDIGSNTKTFIATQILLLEEQGLLTIHDPLYKWLPSFPNIDSTITIQQLLNHTSGVSDFSNENPAWGDSIVVNPDRFWTPEYSLSFVLEPNFDRGKGWSYSNTGYILAGMIIKKVTGSDKVSTILHQQILDPLHLDHTFLDIEENLIGELADGWIHIDDTDEWYTYAEYPRTAIYSSLWTCGAMVSNSGDMARWIRALYGGRVLSPYSLNEMFTLVSFNDPVTLGYGLGTMKRVWFGEELWLHGGDTVCYGSQAAYYPKKDVSIIVLLNERNYPYRSWYDMITEQLFGIVLQYYKYPHDKVHPYDTELANSFVKPNQDTLNIIAHLNNPENHKVRVMAEIVSTDNAYCDSTLLCDDGNHNDGQSNDGVFGGYFNPLAVEKGFNVSIHTVDLDSNYSHTLENAAHFTSIGPVIFENYTFRTSDTEPNPGDHLSVQLSLKNQGLTATAVNVEAHLSSPDSLVSVPAYSRSFGNIGPGKTATAANTYRIDISPDCPDSTTIPIVINIASNEYVFWSDTLTIFVVSPPATSIADRSGNVPRDYALYQNYPNPFNQRTIIGYQLSGTSDVTLDIYNINGQKVVTLISEQQTAGVYKYQWDAGDLASGVYFYKITAGNFEQLKKLISLK